MLDLDPTSPSFLTGIAVSTIGMGLFMYGKRATRPPQVIAGIGLMVVPYFVSSVILLSSIAGAVVAGLYLLTHGKL
jgi:uncharacterized protein (DUF983 family)